jgi:hypothetical protein
MLIVALAYKKIHMTRSCDIIYMPQTPLRDDHPLPWGECRPDGSTSCIFTLSGEPTSVLLPRHPGFLYLLGLLIHRDIGG